MSTWLITDTHGKSITLLPSEFGIEDGDFLVHLGDCGSSIIGDFGFLNYVLVRGNHDDKSTEDKFDFVCDGILINGAWLSHEPVFHLPKGAHLNIHGHLHEDRYEDFGYVKKDFHRRLEPNKLYKLEDIA